MHLNFLDSIIGDIEVGEASAAQALQRLQGLNLVIG